MRISKAQFPEILNRDSLREFVFFRILLHDLIFPGYFARLNGQDHRTTLITKRTRASKILKLYKSKQSKLVNKTTVTSMNQS